MDLKLPESSLQYVVTKASIMMVLVLFFFSNTTTAQITKRDSLLSTINKHKSTSDFSVKDTAYIGKIIDLAYEYRYHDQDSLLILSKESLSLSKKVSFVNGEIMSYQNIGGYYSDKGHTEEALTNFKLAYDLSNKHNNLQLKVESLNDLASEYSNQGNYSQALKSYLKAIELAQKIDYKTLLSIINENMADLYLSQKDYTQAMVFYKKVKAINDKIGNPVFSAETTSNMASAYADMNKLDLAMFNINSSIAVFEKNMILDWLAYCYQIKGKIYLKKRKYSWALHWYRQSELLHMEIEDDREKIALLNGMAEASLQLEKDSIAEIYALRAFDIAENIGLKTGTRQGANLLFQINKNKENYEKALAFHEIYQSMSDSLAKTDNIKALNMLKTKMEYDQQKQQLIQENEKTLAKQKIYSYVFVIILVIFLAIVFIVRRNERIQKKLNIELQSQKIALEEKQQYLNELNETKNKLFSIIGHDLRGPIAAFQGLLKLFKEGEMNKEEFLNFLPKLKVDIDSISFTLNNLLSWGQSQMNGSITNATVTHLDGIVEENIALLSEIADSKSIELVNRVDQNCHLWSDPNQIDIIIRNLLSNAIKFTPNHGQIIIGAIPKLKNCEIYIKDNGLGMDPETVDKIFQKDSNHTTYGTNDEKGTGLGLSLCKEMVIKNGGHIWVNSALGKGSSFYFTIPRASENQKWSA